MIDFSPEALQIAERPPAPLPRRVLYVTLLLFAAACAWTWLGRLDVIAVAQGKIVPQSYLQIVQPADSGILRELLVAEGAQVRAGQVLARFDASIAEADIRQVRNDLEIRALQLRRIDAELAGKPMQRKAEDSPQLYGQLESQNRARRQAHLDQIETERGIIAKAEQDLRSAVEVETKLSKTLPIFRQQETAFDQLTRDGFAGRLMFLDKQRDRIEKEQDLAAQQYNIASLKALIVQGQKRLQQIDSAYRQALQNERVDAEAQHHRLSQEREKHAHRHALLELKAPQDGTVKDLATRTIGSVVSAGTVLMTIVPGNEPLQAEVWVTNQDVGLVVPGQPVQLKFAAYPFQRFGLVHGELVHLSPDASELPQASNLERRRGDLEHILPATGYRALVALKKHVIEADGVRHKVTAGMQVSAEIHLGTRSVFEYLLSPLRKIAHEAGREH